MLIPEKCLSLQAKACEYEKIVFHFINRHDGGSVWSKDRCREDTE